MLGAFTDPPSKRIRKRSYDATTIESTTIGSHEDYVYDEEAEDDWRHCQTTNTTTDYEKSTVRYKDDAGTKRETDRLAESWQPHDRVVTSNNVDWVDEHKTERTRTDTKTIVTNVDANGVETPGGASEIGSVSFSGKSTHDVDTASRSEARYPDGAGTGSVSSAERDIVDQYEGGREWERAYGDPDFGSGEPGYGSDETTYTTLTGDLSGVGDATQIVDGELSQGGYANTPPYDEHVHYESFRNGSVPTVYYAFTLTRGETTGQNRGLGVD